MRKALLCALLLAASAPAAAEVSGRAILESRLFFHRPAYPGQRWNAASGAFEPEVREELGPLRFLAKPFLRVDAGQAERTHVDIRELYLMAHGGSWELRVGVDKVFWGVTETVHLVDIVNQTDELEGFDAEDKLGQPMLKLSWTGAHSTLDLFLLPYFRERAFPGRGGRLRSALPAAPALARYESRHGKWNPDAAVRLSGSAGDWDWGLSHFKGTGREPTLLTGLDKTGSAVLIPLYESIDQTGLDLQWTREAWLFKLEAMRRSGQGPRTFQSAALGFERTFYGVLGTPADVGVLAEWLLDDRGRLAAVPWNRDIAYGLRLGLGDVQSTELLAFIAEDYKNRTKVVSVEAGRRLSDAFKAQLQGYFFLDADPADPLFGVRDDDFLELELGYYF